MKIAFIIEGKTESAFLPKLREFLSKRLAGKMPKIDPHIRDGRIPTRETLKRTVEKLLSGKDAVDHVIALTDVYTGTMEFKDAADAKDKMRMWVGPEPRFHPHAAQHDFEAWLLPYWDSIEKLAKPKTSKKQPTAEPEKVNHNKPPSYHLKEIFRSGKCRDDYQKPRDAKRILKDADLSLAIEKCPQLKALVNTILDICGGEAIP